MQIPKLLSPCELHLLGGGREPEFLTSRRNGY